MSCGEGVRERVRECLLPSGVGGLQCTGMVKEQSLCSLEDCIGQSLFLFHSLCPWMYFFKISLFLISSPFLD